MILLTQTTTPIIGQVAWLLGMIMNALFQALDAIGIANIGLAIILFTIVVKVAMLPLTIKQQKYAKLTNVMNPELQELRKKYKGKKDQDSMMKMNEEQKKIYEKYGTSPTGGCLQVLIQMPILFALYRVVQNIPAYVPSLKVLFTNIISGNGTDGVMSTPGFAETMAENFNKNGNYSTVDTIIDVMNKFSADNWKKLTELFPNYADIINTNVDKINHMNNFLGVNMAQNPGFVLGLPILIPILAGLTQWLSVKLTQTPAMTDDDDNPAAASMKMMTTFMPIMSAVFAVSLPAGLGLYWIAQAVVQIVLQLIVNKHIDRIGVDNIIKKNVEKNSKKKQKKAGAGKDISNSANLYAKNVEKYAQKNSDKIQSLKKIKEDNDKKAKTIVNQTETKSGKAGSIAERAGMVSKYNEKNNKK